MPADNRPRAGARHGTFEEIEAYERRSGGGNGDGGGPKESLVDQWTHSVRKKAKDILRQQNLQHSPLFNDISKGGLKGAVAALFVLRYNAPSEP